MGEIKRVKSESQLRELLADDSDIKKNSEGRFITSHDCDVTVVDYCDNFEDRRDYCNAVDVGGFDFYNCLMKNKACKKFNFKSE